MEMFAPASPLLGCPDRVMLIDFDLGKLSAQDLDAVAQHTCSCSSCEQFLHALHGRPNEDCVIDRLKKSLGSAPFPDEAMETPPATSSETVKLDALASTLGGWPAESDRRAFEAINKYELLGKIGQGGMGVVYRARQVALNRMVALKMILAGYEASAQTTARFLREGKAVARLRHPNIVQVYELGESEGLPYYTMELVEGRDLKQRLADGPFEPREAAELVRTLAAAAEYAHREGILHRDLKPANILLAEDGTPRITDFGLAKWLDAESGEATSVALTEAEAILGTPSYMAPEQAEGRSEEVGRATDVYALGVILYEALTGRPPFVGGTKIQTLALVRSAEPVPPSHHRPEVPSWLGAICLKCLEKSPARRYPSAQALADDLESWLRDERPEGIPKWFTKFSRGVRRHVAAVLVGATMFSVGAASYLHVNAPERAIRKVESELARGRAVTLIGATGKANWSRWLIGESESHSILAGDTFVVQSWMTSLLELVPDPRSDSYRLTAQIRHDTSIDTGSRVGLYFARKASPGNRRNIQFFTYVGFNDVRKDTDLKARIALLAANVKFVRPPRKNSADLVSCLLSDEAEPPNDERRIGLANGPRFDPLGEKNGRWHDLEVIVTPASVTARWNGQSFSMATAEIQRRVDMQMKRFPPAPTSPLRRGPRPKFETRGGLGLFVTGGSAAFRRVTVTPLQTPHPFP